MYKIKKSSFTQLEKPPLQSTRFSKGFWLDQFNLCKDVILGNIYRLFDSDEISHCLANFRIAANLQKGSHQGPPFGDGDFYKWLEAASYIYGLTKDEKLKALIDSSISLIEQVQREDGYIFTQYTIKLKEGASAQKLGNSLNFEAYNLGHLITTAIVHTQTTGEDTLLKIGIKAAFCLKELFEEAEKSNTAKTAICPSHYMALVDLYRYTGDEVHLKTAQLAIKLRDKVEQGTDDNQDRLKLAEHTEILGHAVRATYLYSGVADLYAELGSEELKTMLDRIWESEEHCMMESPLLDMQAIILHSTAPTKRMEGPMSYPISLHIMRPVLPSAIFFSTGDFSCSIRKLHMPTGLSNHSTTSFLLR